MSSGTSSTDSDLALACGSHISPIKHHGTYKYGCYYSYLDSSSSQSDTELYSGTDDGVLLVARINAKARYAIPSLDNDFHGYRVRVVLIDPGCCQHLLPVSSTDDLEGLQQIFPSTEYSRTFCPFNNRLCVLKIRNLTPSRVLTAHLAQDLTIPPNSLFPHTLQVTMSEFNFHLCREDVEYLQCRPDFVMNSDVLLSFDAQRVDTARRSHAVIGQSVLRRCASVLAHDCMVSLQIGSFQSCADETDLKILCNDYITHIPALPEEIMNGDFVDSDLERSFDVMSLAAVMMPLPLA